MVWASIDRECVSSRRWIVHLVFCNDEELFGAIMELLLATLQGNEVQVCLTHYEQDERLSECKAFKQTLKDMGFKWTQ